MQLVAFQWIFNCIPFSSKWTLNSDYFVKTQWKSILGQHWLDQDTTTEWLLWTWWNDVQKTPIYQTVHKQ